MRVFASAALAAALWWTGGSADGTRRPELSPERAASLAASAEAAKTGDAKAGLADVARLLRASPREPRYLSLRAALVGRVEGPAAEAAAWEEYAAVAPFPTEACPALGRAYGRAGAPEKALDAHKRCLSWDPTNVDLRLAYARALSAAGRDAEAEALYRGILKDAPADDDAALLLGGLLLRRGDAKGAAALIEPLAARKPDDPDALLFAAMLDRERGDLARAETRLRRVLVLSPGYADAKTVLEQVVGARRRK
jgi:tetratricopeptide (TPR) repeat protein